MTRQEGCDNKGGLFFTILFMSFFILLSTLFIAICNSPTLAPHQILSNLVASATASKHVIPRGRIRGTIESLLVLLNDKRWNRGPLLSVLKGQVHITKTRKHGTKGGEEILIRRTLDGTVKVGEIEIHEGLER